MQMIGHTSQPSSLEERIIVKDFPSEIRTNNEKRADHGLCIKVRKIGENRCIEAPVAAGPGTPTGRHGDTPIAATGTVLDTPLFLELGFPMNDRARE
jgi:hypothetical protein